LPNEAPVGPLLRLIQTLAGKAVHCLPGLGVMSGRCEEDGSPHDLLVIWRFGGCAGEGGVEGIDRSVAISEGDGALP
jgi:hypothetical protein